MKKQVRIEDRKLWLDDKPIPMVSAEIHYWRLEPSIWPKMLDAAREMGLETIASYVQWHFHEFEEGRFDFDGKTDPKRNLVAYLELVAQSGLNLIIRPGPYTFAEWDNYGVPDYAAIYHRLHTKFQAAASRYIEKVCAVIRPYLAANGGPIVLLQPDNMFDLGQYRFDRQLGLLGGEGPFQEFLRERYGTIDALNSTWCTDYLDFVGTMAYMSKIHHDQASQARFMDFIDFKHWFTKQAAAWTVGQYRQNGIDLPVYVNATYDQDYEMMSNVLDLVGFNHYPSTDYGRSSDEHRFLFDEIRLLPMFSDLPYVVELESGMWHGDHYFKGMPYPDHYRYMMLSVLAGGAVAWSWYMLHDRDNWYMSPVSSRGTKRVEVFSIFSKFVEIVKEHKPEEWVNCSDSAIAYSQRHQTAHFFVPEYREMYKTARAFYQAGIDHGFYSLSSPGKPPKILFYDGLDWLDQEAQQTLVNYVKNGGHLVVFQKHPTMDEHGKACNLLQIQPADGIDSQSYMTTFYMDYQVHLGDKDIRISLPDGIHWYHQVPGEPIYAARVPTQDLNDSVLHEYQFIAHQGSEDNLLVGYRERRGMGSLTVFGMAPTPALVKALHDDLEVPTAAFSETPGVQVILYRREDRHYLIVLNTGEEEKGVEIILDKSEFPGRSYIAHDLLDQQEKHIIVHPDEQRMLFVQVAKKNGAIFEIYPHLGSSSNL